MAHSGSPFRQLLQDPASFDASAGFVEFAIQAEQCAPAHARFVTENGGALRWLTDIRNHADSAEAQFAAELRSMGASGAPLFVSFDLDSVRGSDAPGVSCAAVRGLSADEALSMMDAAGRNPSVRLVDLSEFNPDEEEYRTGRLVAFMFHSLARGVFHRRGRA